MHMHSVAYITAQSLSVSIEAAGFDMLVCVVKEFGHLLCTFVWNLPKLSKFVVFYCRIYFSLRMRTFAGTRASASAAIDGSSE